MAKALGTDDSITTCDCCGRANLKFTVAIELDDGEVVHYGQVCAARNTGKTQKVIRAEIATEAKRVREAAAAEYLSSAEHRAYVLRLTERNRLSWDDPRRMGKAGFEFVRDASDAADLVRANIAAKHGLKPFEVHA